MQLRCPHCRSLVGVPDGMRCYFGMPVACHLCQRAFVVPPQSPLHDAALPADSVRPLDRSISAIRCFHEQACPHCQRQLRIPGLNKPTRRIDLSCPYCETTLTIGGAPRLAPKAIITALVIGLLMGGGVLWLDQAGLIALQNFQASHLLLEWKQALQRLGIS